MQRHTIAVFAGLILAAAVRAQPGDVEPPLSGQPPRFSRVVGSYTLGVTAEPTAVAVEEPITLRVRIEGRGPAKYQPRREHLQLFPEDWDKDFYVEPVPGEDRADAEQGVWEFVYRLRPKHAHVEAIDGLRLIYYTPERRRYQTTYADPIPLTVRPRPAATVPEQVPIATAPPSFYELTEDVLDRREPPSPPAGWLVALLLLAPPALTVVAVRGWFALFPDAREQYRRRLRQAAARALQQLQGDASEPAWVVMSRYLGERLDVSLAEPTPAEVRQALRRRGVARPLCREFEAFYQACDAVRFGAASADALPREAIRLIHALEADPCVH